jgi:hypothetical protein
MNFLSRDSIRSDSVKVTSLAGGWPQIVISGVRSRLPPSPVARAG